MRMKLYGNNFFYRSLIVVVFTLGIVAIIASGGGGGGDDEQTTRYYLDSDGDGYEIRILQLKGKINRPGMLQIRVIVMILIKTFIPEQKKFVTL